MLETGGPQVMPWLDQVSAVLEAWYPGQRGGAAIANILFGDVNPSGKLPLTFPNGVTDLPHPQIPFFTSENPVTFDVNYGEGFLVGYKWYQARKIEPLFPFGYGLSYSTFSFANLKVTRDRWGSSEQLVHVSFDVSNTSGPSGSEVAQIYLALPASANEPPKRLVAWRKLFLEPRQSRHIDLDIDADASSHPLSIWNANNNAWEIVNGDYVTVRAARLHSGRADLQSFLSHNPSKYFYRA